MISVVLVIGIWTLIHTYPSHGVSKERVRTLLHALFRIVTAISIIMKGGLRTVRTASHTLLVLSRSVICVWAYWNTGIIDSFPKQVLPDWTYSNTPPGGIIREERRGTTDYTQISNRIGVPSIWTISHTITSSDIAITLVWTLDNAYSTDVLCIASIADIAADA
jgi:hypothetical protein